MRYHITPCATSSVQQNYKYAIYNFVQIRRYMTLNNKETPRPFTSALLDVTIPKYHTIVTKTAVLFTLGF